MRNVTVVITSCNRNDLLIRTLKSFFDHNSYPIDKVIIVDDSGVGNDLDWGPVKNEILSDFEIILNKKNLGQIASVDLAYSKVMTDFIFHCEEDWEFYDKNFIEKSFEILDQDPNIFTVWLRAYNDTKNHPIVREDKFILPSGDFYYVMEQYHKKVWCGFTFNPGLRRTKDCMLLHPYNDLEVRELSKKNNMNIMHEMDLSIYYQELNYRAAITSNEKGYVRHIGGKRHIPLPWQIK